MQPAAACIFYALKPPTANAALEAADRERTTSIIRFTVDIEAAHEALRPCFSSAVAFAHLHVRGMVHSHEVKCDGEVVALLTVIPFGVRAEGRVLHVKKVLGLNCHGKFPWFQVSATHMT